MIAEDTDSILYWKARLEEMTRRWDAAVHEVHLLRGGAKMLRQEMDKRIAEAVMAEREACAKVCEKRADWLYSKGSDAEFEAEDCADSIRMRTKRNEPR